MEKMQVNDFQLFFDQKTEGWFVKKVKDELTKNHRKPEQIVSGIMPENRDDPLCPVKSFRKYLEHLSPKNTFLWQKPFDDGHKKGFPNIWYTNQHIGRNILSKFMPEVSTNCGLSQIYHNHSIRATGITVLTRMNYTPSQIMSVSGHKSVQSLSIYQKTAQKEKIEMGKVLFQSVTKPEDEIQRPDLLEIAAASPLKALPPAPIQNAVNPTTPQEEGLPQNASTGNEIVQFEPNFDEDTVSDVDLLSALCAVENNNQSTVATTSTNVLNSFPQAMFSNCGNITIGTINFNINK